jgi:toxin ParE1/3/4
MLFKGDVYTDVVEAVDWYAHRQEGFADEFLSELKTTLSRVRENPRQFERVWKNTRHALVKRFPYVVYFQLMKNDEIVVVAVLHTSRNPRIWKSRS